MRCHSCDVRLLEASKLPNPLADEQYDEVHVAEGCGPETGPLGCLMAGGDFLAGSRAKHSMVIRSHYCDAAVQIHGVATPARKTHT